jgi:lysophospholipid acyltransferase (LPLAT)-like uncharacterized protein
MKLRSPWLIRIIAFLAGGLIRLWMCTVRHRKTGSAASTQPADPRVARYIYAFWHESLLLPTTFKTPCRVLIRQHADGELIAQICLSLGFQVVRGSTTRGGAGAMLNMANKGQAAHLAFTPDGPRGPRRQAQLGVIAVASLTGLPIVAYGVAYGRAWRARNWDRFAVPLPFTTAYGVVAPELRVPPKLDREELERYRRLFEERLADATTAAENWAETGVEPPAAAAPDLKASA